MWNAVNQHSAVHCNCHSCHSCTVLNFHSAQVAEAHIASQKSITLTLLGKVACSTLIFKAQPLHAIVRPGAGDRQACPNAQPCPPRWLVITLWHVTAERHQVTDQMPKGCQRHSPIHACMGAHQIVGRKAAQMAQQSTNSHPRMLKLSLNNRSQTSQQVSQPITFKGINGKSIMHWRSSPMVFGTLCLFKARYQASCARREHQLAAAHVQQSSHTHGLTFI